MSEKELFNKQSLEALDNKDNILESAKITRPSLIVVLGAMVMMCIVVGDGCIIGT